MKRATKKTSDWKRKNGIVLWEGPSRFNGAQVALVATGLLDNSTNGKTGAMVQTYVIYADAKPTEACKAGLDDAICGDCNGRPSREGWCYVNKGQGPRGVWSAYRAGKYPYVTMNRENAIRYFAGRSVRIGTYGDPAAVPTWVWEIVLRYAENHTGYTHAWNRPEGQGLKGLVMASADDFDKAIEAQRQGWKGVFRVRCPGEALMEGEKQCPAANHGTTCEKCHRCNGCALVSIEVHGAVAKRYTDKHASA